VQEWLTLAEIGEIYGASRNGNRARLDRMHKQMRAGSTKEDIETLCKEGTGPHPTQYHRSLVESAFGIPNETDITDAQRRVFQGKGIHTVRASGGTLDDLPRGILASRKLSNSEYWALASEMIACGSGLRIRCITGTDFFRAYRVNA
jgi:hypothetical protein